MRPVGRLSRLLGMAVAVGVLVGITAQAAPVQNKAVVTAVRGTANYSQDRGANWKKLNVGAQLSQNSVIRTAPGSIVDLYLGENGPVVRVTEDTTVGIDRLTVDDLVALWKTRSKASRKPSLPARSSGQARAQIRAGERGDGKADLKWSGGRAGSQ